MNRQGCVGLLSTESLGGVFTEKPGRGAVAWDYRVGSVTAGRDRGSPGPHPAEVELSSGAGLRSPSSPCANLPLPQREPPCLTPAAEGRARLSPARAASERGAVGPGWSSGREGGEGKKGRAGAAQGRDREQDGAGGAGAEEFGVAEAEIINI